jgi:CCR4-NOT transcription complex subunit 6
MTLMREIENFVIPRDIAVIVCGDFNSEPDSAVYEFLSEGALDQPRPELEQSDTVGILPDQSEIHHRVDLASVMGTVLGSEPEFTNFTSTFKGTLDYVWYTPGRLRVLAASNVPDANDLTATCGEGLPSASYPSDHIMLCADMTLTVTGAGTITRQQTAPQVPHRRGMPVGGLASGGLGGAGTMKKPGQYGGNAMRSALGGR